MTSGVSVISAAAGASASSSFTATDAAVIFVVAIVLLLLAVALIGLRTRLLVGRPRLRTTHSRGSGRPPKRMSRRSSGTPGSTAARCTAPAAAKKRTTTSDPFMITFNKGRYVPEIDRDHRSGLPQRPWGPAPAA